MGFLCIIIVKAFLGGKNTEVGGRIYHRDKHTLARSSLYHLCKMK